MAINAVQLNKTVADPIAAYESILPLWKRNRAVCSGERFVKEYDAYLDNTSFSNLLIPFSPSMSQGQFDFYRAEAELPGIVSQYTKMVVGGLLRKKPQLKLPDDAPADAKDWIMNCFGEDDKSLTTFLDDALWEEMQTSRTWIYVDYPSIANPEQYTREEMLQFKPYPVIWKAESVINWTIARDVLTGQQRLTRVIVRHNEQDFSKNEFHADIVDTVFVHELVEGYYRIRKYIAKAAPQNVQVVNGKEQTNYDSKRPVFELVETIENILMNGERLTMIPAWPMNGTIGITEPVLTALVDKEIALYNKVSRRNHLLYGAATYTPVLSANISDEQFDAIVGAGLGSWIRLNQGDTASILDTPTNALVDMDRAIASAIEEMAKLGIRMLTPETAQSGVALDLRNAAQTAQLGTLNAKVSTQLGDIIAFMLNWRYGTAYTAGDVDFSMSADFNPSPLGADWLRLATEWYQSGLIPRNVWLALLKQNDIVDPEYDDVAGQQEINNDELVVNTQEQAKFNNALMVGGG